MRKHILAAVIGGLLTASGYAQDFNKDLQRAVDAYVGVINGLQAQGALPKNEWGSYTKTTDVDEAWTVSAVPGLFAFRHIAPNMDRYPKEFESWVKNKGFFFEGRTISLFLPNGAGFISRTGAFDKNPGALIAYDKDKGVRRGADVIPYLAQILPRLHVEDLPKIGNQKPTFIFVTSPSCPYSLAVDPVLVNSGMSYRVYPTFGVNPWKDFPYVNKIFCSNDRLAEWRKQLATRPLPDLPVTSNQCEQSAANYARADLDLLMGEGNATPSFYFADGTIITGANQLELVRQKSKEMERKGVFFQ